MPAVFPVNLKMALNAGRPRSFEKLGTNGTSPFVVSLSNHSGRYSDRLLAGAQRTGEDMTGED
jgi:hypothetical protein